MGNNILLSFELKSWYDVKERSFETKRKFLPENHDFLTESERLYGQVDLKFKSYSGVWAITSIGISCNYTNLDHPVGCTLNNRDYYPPGGELPVKVSVTFLYSKRH